SKTRSGVVPAIVLPQASAAVGSSAAISVTEQERVMVGSDATLGTGAGELALRLQPRSFTVTLKLQLELLPAGSVAVQRTSVVPTGKFAPEANGSQLTVTLPLLSVAVNCDPLASGANFPVGTTEV